MLTLLLQLLSRDPTDLDVITSAGVLCGQCVSSDDAATSFCCQEVPEMESIKCTGIEPLSQCFTQHEALKAKTSVWTLYTSTNDDGTLLLQHRKTNIDILPIGI